MPNVITEIKEWARTIPYWERFILDKLLSGVIFNEADYEQALKYLLEDSGLSIQEGERLKFPYLDTQIHEHEEQRKPIIITKLQNTQNVNALVSGQTLEFSPTLTIIYGPNGSGKSGYARVLGCAGFTRGDKEVLPDVTKPVTEDMVLSADIGVNDGELTHIITYKVGTTCTELSQCYVFDSTSMRVHLTGSNTFSFIPGSLFYLTQLAEITDSVRHRLQTKIELANQPQDFTVAFQGISMVTEFISRLSASTDFEDLTRLATLSPEEQNRITELDLEIARLKSQNIEKEINRLRKSSSDLGLLKKQIMQLEVTLSSEYAEEVVDLVNKYMENEKIARLLTIDDFKSDHFQNIGTEVWRRFVEAANILAEAESQLGKQYPQDGDYCLLCHQLLSKKASEMLLKLWDYLKSDTQTKLESSRIALQEKVNGLKNINFDFFNDQLVSYRLISEEEPQLLKDIIKYIDKSRLRRDSLLEKLQSRTSNIVVPIVDLNMERLNVMIETTNIKLTSLEEKKTDQQISELSQELCTLQHRQTLEKLKEDISAYIRRKKWALRASSIGGDTRHITSKYKLLFGQLVTDHYIEIFNAILSNLERPLKVMIKTVGRKGQTLKHIVIDVDTTVRQDIATPDKVLSEGEKRAVALADFLTEVALDTTSGTIILDDPVTSLDLEWRAAVADILVNESKKRQTIIFTHDLPFLYQIKKYAEEKDVKCMSHWIRRINDKPGFVSLNDSPVLERDYRNPARAREFLTKAKKGTGQEQDDLLIQGYDALRASYEAFIVYDLLGDVVRRFEERISPSRLKEIRWDKAIANEVNARYEEISRYIGGHLHTDVTPRPALQRLSDEIDAFEKLRSKHKDLKNS
jgi:energy-coupling factor transporter ATP-binding protein EcfA2